MDTRQAQESGQAGEPAPQRDPAPPMRQVFAAEGGPAKEGRGEPAVATDGQLVEAGYGHGV